jgi:hypothetical protein
VTNLPDEDGRLGHGGADSGELGLGVGDGLPKLGPAAAGLVHLPLVGLEALLLELEQHRVPRGVLLPDLVPDDLRAHTHATNQPRAIVRPAVNHPTAVHNRRGSGRTWTSRMRAPQAVSIWRSWSLARCLPLIPVPQPARGANRGEPACRRAGRRSGWRDWGGRSSSTPCAPGGGAPSRG